MVMRSAGGIPRRDILGGLRICFVGLWPRCVFISLMFVGSAWRVCWDRAAGLWQAEGVCFVSSCLGP